MNKKILASCAAVLVVLLSSAAVLIALLLMSSNSLEFDTEDLEAFAKSVESMKAHFGESDDGSLAHIQQLELARLTTAASSVLVLASNHTDTNKELKVKIKRLLKPFKGISVHDKKFNDRVREAMKESAEVGESMKK